MDTIQNKEVITYDLNLVTIYIAHFQVVGDS
jgi:hypothetical protein